MKAVRLEIDGHTAILTLDRPEDGNRLNATIFGNLSGAVEELAGNRELRARLLR